MGYCQAPVESLSRRNRHGHICTNTYTIRCKAPGLIPAEHSQAVRGQPARSRCDISLFEHHVNYSLLRLRALRWASLSAPQNSSTVTGKFFLWSSFHVYSSAVFRAVVCMGRSTFVSGEQSILNKKSGLVLTWTLSCQVQFPNREYKHSGVRNIVTSSYKHLELGSCVVDKRITRDCKNFEKLTVDHFFLFYKFLYY